ncbi:hypothetical protein GCM10011371_13600 [Novosphingobium marinum]|uniref:Right-handed parallel beta-helix repeat-containing protein n=1 Tax=Novosphingobium marinum TaxID=1514948 RepID=A0A7Y9XY84_9SPHN|nr:hypothetical protein [Novosphingobium marinum]NYH95468.1 hypothetical protein [Novosphingobium marinum]GGC27335.1 hypothetical protein GCM10011371_13600 [Novosphingobium marinum]
MRTDDAGLFIGLAQLSIPRDVRRIRTEGWSRHGLGAAEYIADDKADAALAREHPRFCTATANGRHFRLEAADGAIAVEQAGARGDPAADNAHDDQPAFQAAVDYAAAFALPRITLAQPLYSIRCPERYLDPRADHRTLDGRPIVLHPGQRIAFVGTGTEPSRLAFRSRGGHSFGGNQPGRAFQVVDGKVWRGSGFYLPGAERVDLSKGSLTGPKAQRLRLERLVVDGGTKRTANSAPGADPRTGDGWDVTHKGIWSELDREGWDIEIVDCSFTGWRGETVYASNDPGATLTVRNSEFAHSNAQGLNTAGCMVDVGGARIEDCFIGIEGWMGARGGRIVATEIVDCFGKKGIGGSGSAFALQGGRYGKSERSRYYAPTEVDPGEAPWGTLDITCRNSRPAYAGSWLKGRLRLVDTALFLGSPAVFGEGARHVDLRVELVTDRTTDAFVLLAGGDGQPGDMLTDDVALDIVSSATPLAEAENLRPAAPLVWRGSFGPNVAARVSGRAASLPPGPEGKVPDHAPRIERR